jgi:hypothetical protein
MLTGEAIHSQNWTRPEPMSSSREYEQPIAEPSRATGVDGVGMRARTERCGQGDCASTVRVRTLPDGAGAPGGVEAVLSVNVPPVTSTTYTATFCCVGGQCQTAAGQCAVPMDAGADAGEDAAMDGGPADAGSGE